MRANCLRRGFTLLEMMLVVGLLALFAGMTIPSVLRILGEQKLGNSAEKVRAAVASTRVQAIESGIIYQFCCESNGSRYAVVPFEPDHANSGQASPTGATNLQGRLSGRLPKGITFSNVVVKVSGTAAMATGSQKIASGAFDGLPGSGELAGLSWSVPILFHPEGTANADAEITVSDSRRQHILLRVRAFTGAVSMDRMVAEK